jgi:hypothetical protein
MKINISVPPHLTKKHENLWNFVALRTWLWLFWKHNRQYLKTCIFMRW